LEAGDFPEVALSADRQSITRMLTNLIENAIKYTATNNTGAERKVCIETGCASNGTEAWVRVSDSGPGIPKENLPHLFDRFYRVDQSRARSDSDSPSGVGLGLAIAQWIAHLHGGEIAVESELNVGTTFTVKLPIHSDGLQK
jgi:signal transduction histidine kinase